MPVAEQPEKVSLDLEAVRIEIALQLPAILKFEDAWIDPTCGSHLRVRMTHTCTRQDPDARSVPDHLMIGGVRCWPANVFWREDEVTVLYVSNDKWFKHWEF